MHLCSFSYKLHDRLISGSSGTTKKKNLPLYAFSASVARALQLTSFCNRTLDRISPFLKKERKNFSETVCIITNLIELYLIIILVVEPVMFVQCNPRRKCLLTSIFFVYIKYFLKFTLYADRLVSLYFNKLLSVCNLRHVQIECDALNRNRQQKDEGAYI